MAKKLATMDQYHWNTWYHQHMRFERIERRIREAFTPEKLFANGEQGALYEPWDLTTLYQDAAGTTPVTADGDPVGLMLDKSGNSKTLDQATAAARLTFSDSVSFKSLGSDGVDDEIFGQIFDGTENLDEVWLFFAGQIENSANPCYGFSRATGFLGLVLAGTRCGVRVESGGTFHQIDVDSFSEPAVISARLNKTSRTLTVYRNLVEIGVVSITGTAWLDGVDYNFGVGSVDLTAAFSVVDFRGGLLVESALTPSQHDSTVNYLAQKSGITL